jgi:hypothetical protein
MNTYADKTQENKSQSVSNETSKKQGGGESTFQFVDNRPEAIVPRKLQEMANNSPQVSQLKAFQDMANNSPQAKQMTQLQAMDDNYTAQQQQPIQKKENNTGLPDNLKTGMENLSGISLDDVKVHRNSDKPAQLRAHAYAQGTDIHLGPGQEKHLPHEAWHVVQQKQGRVKPTIQMKGKVNINDDAGLEKEADMLGTKTLQLKSEQRLISSKSIIDSDIIQRVLASPLEGINDSYLKKFEGQFPQFKLLRNRRDVLGVLIGLPAELISDADLLREIPIALANLGLAEEGPVVVEEDVVVAEEYPVVVEEDAVVAEEDPVFTEERTARVATYDGALNLASRWDLTTNKLFTPFGGGVNKTAYGINGSPWVVLCAPASKMRLIKAEIEQILALNESGVDTPSLGGSQIFNVLEGGEEKIAFLEEKIDGFEIPRAGTAFSLDDVKAFGVSLVSFIGDQQNIETAELKRAAGLNSIELLTTQVGTADIPDFQVRLDRPTGRILALDPGDPLNSENAQTKHLSWLTTWKRDLTDKRYLSRIWNEKHPDNKVLKNGNDWQ